MLENASQVKNTGPSLADLKLDVAILKVDAFKIAMVEILDAHN